MSLYSALNASASGMRVQTTKLAVISDNIANANTTGYKQASAEFESMVDQYRTTDYSAAGVTAMVRNHIAEQGELASSVSSTDLGISGNGFFIVQDANGASFLTRAGSFTQDSSGNLVNAAGFTLMGYKPDTNVTSADGLAGLEPVNVLTNDLKALPSTEGTFSANLNSDAPFVTGNLPSTNTAPVTFTSKSSLVAYDNLGKAVTLDIYFSKTASNTWEVSLYNADDASASDSFPYTSSALVTSTLNFSAADGSLTSPSALTVAVPGGQTLDLDISHTTQLAADFAVTTATVNGHAPSTLQRVDVARDGTVSGVYADGSETALYKIPLATVPSVDSLEPEAGSVYRAGFWSGNIVVGDAGLGGLGTIQASTLEMSTVDLATQLSDMIVAQRSYQSNTKAFQTSSDLLGQLVQMLT
jgi:flagellar hook protein FlgE